jgi:hypothetical protein
MSWAIGFDTKWKRDIGWGVPAFCDHPGCGAEINRGLACVCSDGQPYGGDGCGLYFCSKHLGLYRVKKGKHSMMCERCGAHKEPFTPTPDHPDWIHHKMTDESWKAWRDKHAMES